VHAPTDPFPMGALAPTAPGKSAPMTSTNNYGSCCCRLLVPSVDVSAELRPGAELQVWIRHRHDTKWQVSDRITITSWRPSAAAEISTARCRVQTVCCRWYQSGLDQQQRSRRHQATGGLTDSSRVSPGYNIGLSFCRLLQKWWLN